MIRDAAPADAAPVEGRVPGFAIHLHHPSTWVLTGDCHREGLFVAPQAGGMGLGRALIDDAIARARA